ncbi:MAG: hypothetical protein ACJAUO_002032 [Sediminicola sp.]|jgi:hypothetical protein
MDSLSRIYYVGEFHPKIKFKWTFNFCAKGYLKLKKSNMELLKATA